MICVFVFKQKTAYEMRISDWSSDVCSSDLEGDLQVIGFHLPGELIGLDALGTGIHRCDAVALAPASVCEVPFNELGHIAAQVPSLQRQLLRVMGQRMDRNQVHVEMMGRRHASERLAMRSEEHTSELQSLMRISYAVFCLKTKIQTQ